MVTINRLFQVSLIRLIRAYRFSISLLLQPCCRFEPSCSTYMMDAITLHGSFKGVYLGTRRLLRCHPWHSGGSDPVPPAEDQMKQCNCFQKDPKTPDPIYQPRS